MEAVYHPRLRHKGRMILCLLFGVKRNSKLFRALLHFLLFVATALPAFAQVYKWVDERGVTHYGERPPQGSKASEVPNRLASPAPGAAGAEASNPKDPSPEQGQARPKDRDPRQASNKGESTQEAAAAKRAQVCNQQRALLERLKQSPPSYTLNEKGERIPLDNSAAIARGEGAKCPASPELGRRGCPSCAPYPAAGRCFTRRLACTTPRSGQAASAWSPAASPSADSTTVRSIVISLASNPTTAQAVRRPRAWGSR